MFNDEEAVAFRDMQGFSAADGFAEIAENLADMLKFVANEPSVGLFYVQQHIQNAAPNLVNLKNSVAEKSDNTAIHTQDLEDSISMVKSMKECGLPVADEMIRDIQSSLAVISMKQKKRPSSGFLRRSSSFFSPASWGRNAADVQQEGDGGYLSSVFFKPSKQRPDEINQSTSEAHLLGSSFTASKPESEELPLSSEAPEELSDKESQLDENLSHQQLVSLYANYDEFKADKEAKLEEWLANTGRN